MKLAPPSADTDTPNEASAVSSDAAHWIRYAEPVNSFSPPFGAASMMLGSVVSEPKLKR